MPVEVIVCAVCGFRAHRVSVGGHGSLTINPADLANVCKSGDRSAAMLGTCQHWIEAQTRTRRVRR